jgi:hypothetical protein
VKFTGAGAVKAPGAVMARLSSLRCNCGKVRSVRAVWQQRRFSNCAGGVREELYRRAGCDRLGIERGYWTCEVLHRFVILFLQDQVMD